MSKINEARVLANNGQYKAVSSGGVVRIMYKGKEIASGDFDSGADGWFVMGKNDKGQKFFGDAQDMIDYFVKNKVTEDAPANSIASGGVDMAPNAVSKKKQKEIQKYDGRTKESKAFIRRMGELRAKREANFRKSVKENMDNFGEEYLNEANVDVLQKIVKDKQNNKIKLKDEHCELICLLHLH